jgi:hypothetical protein
MCPPVGSRPCIAYTIGEEGESHRYEVWGTVVPPRLFVRECFPDGSMPSSSKPASSVRVSASVHRAPE